MIKFIEIFTLIFSGGMIGLITSERASRDIVITKSLIFALFAILVFILSDKIKKTNQGDLKGKNKTIFYLINILFYIIGIFILNY